MSELNVNGCPPVPGTQNSGPARPGGAERQHGVRRHRRCSRRWRRSREHFRKLFHRRRPEQRRQRHGTARPLLNLMHEPNRAERIAAQIEK